MTTALRLPTGTRQSANDGAGHAVSGSPAAQLRNTSSVPRRLSALPPTPLSRVSRVRNLSLVESTDRFGRLLLLLENRRWSDPITTRPRLGSLELWQLINTTPNTHPIHIHEIHFRILNRQPFDVDHFNRTGKLRFTGAPLPRLPMNGD